MALRDQETQPQDPDLGASVQLETGETLEDIGDSDALDAGYVPPDRPYLLDEDGVTGAGMRDGDTLDQRLDREQDVAYTDPDRAGRIVVQDATGAVSTPDALQGEDVGIDGGAASAEEAAMHERVDGRIGDVGAPVETEPSVADDPSLRDPELEASLAADPAEDEAAEAARRDLLDG